MTDDRDEAAPGHPGAASDLVKLGRIEREVVGCRRCPRLVVWREKVGREKRRAYADEEYWAAPVPGFGDASARIFILGLAPAAHGANRTGRVFTGDRSGDWLFAALYRAGMATQPTSEHRGDGLALSDVFVTAAVKCAPPDNKPLISERDNCHPWARDELRAMRSARVILCLGGFAWNQALKLLADLGHPWTSPKPRFGHGAEVRIGPYTILGSYHPSQQNTFTGRLTEDMLDGIFARAREIADGYSSVAGTR
jgi:uracil-DNA glycosylase